nr:unnamed protein product [Digitaria exilis]
MGRRGGGRRLLEEDDGSTRTGCRLPVRLLAVRETSDESVKDLVRLEKVINANTAEVDWERSFYLNLIAHTSYNVTVAIFGCFHSIGDLHNRAEKSKKLTPVYKLTLCQSHSLEQVTKTVYASPSRVNFHLDRRKAVETVPAYPNICFSVDDFDDTFDAVRTLFSGYVSYQNVREAYNAGRSKFGNFLGHDNNKLDRLYMRGPEGRGEVEVAVSGIADQSHEKSKKDPGDSFRVLVHRAAFAASKLAKHAYESASANKRMDNELVPLKCCLMSVSLPWDYIAHDLLHKDTPPLDI